MSPGTGGRWVGPAPTGGRRVPPTRRAGGASPYRSAEAGHDTAEVPGVAIGPLVGAEAVLMLTNEAVPEAPLKGAVSWPMLISGRDVSPLPVVPTVLASALTGVFTSTNEPPALGLVPSPTTTTSGDVAVCPWPGCRSRRRR